MIINYETMTFSADHAAVLEWDRKCDRDNGEPCTHCLPRIESLRAEVLKFQRRYAVQSQDKPVMSESNSTIDYAAVWSDQMGKMVSEFGPLTDISAGSDNEKVLDIISKVRQRREQLELAIEELRRRGQAMQQYEDDATSKLDSTKKAEKQAADMNHRQKKQIEKIDRGRNLSELQRANFIKTAMDIGMDKELINEKLRAKGFAPIA